MSLLLSIWCVMGVQFSLHAVEKPRVIVLTDISNEPDDEESLVRFLVYSNEYDVEGLIATTSVWLRDTTRAQDGSVHTTAQATIWRWRRAYQYDFAARMDWCVKPFEEANHNPVVLLEGQQGKEVIQRQVKAGETIELSAIGTTDPDGDDLTYSWWYYPEAGTYYRDVTIYGEQAKETSVEIPENAEQDDELHIICEVRDNGNPPLTAYRRLILTVTE